MSPCWYEKDDAILTLIARRLVPLLVIQLCELSPLVVTQPGIDITGHRLLCVCVLLGFFLYFAVHLDTDQKFSPVFSADSTILSNVM